MKNRVRISLGYYFPFLMNLVAVLVCLAGIALLFVKPQIGAPLLILGAIVITARYRLEVNLTNRSYHDYLWVAGFKSGERGTFNHIECLYLNESKYSQQVHSRASTMTRYGTEYNGYIKFDTDEVHLLSDDSKRKVVKKLEKLSEKLRSNVVLSTDITINAEVLDYTKEPENSTLSDTTN